MRRFIRLVEVGPRDGLQNVKRILSPEVKAGYINYLLRSGIREIEVGSFVSDVVTQMQTTRRVIELIKRPLEHQTNLIALVGNKRYAEEASMYPIDTFAVFTSVSEQFCQRNNGCNIQKNSTRIQEIAKVASQNKKRLRGYVSCVFGCPFEGYPDHYLSKTAEIVRELLELGCYEVSIADTISTATTSSIISTVGALVNAGIDTQKIAIHLHDIKGKASTNMIVALASGISVMDCATGSIGGCPSVPDPNSNIDTRTVLKVLENMRLLHSITDMASVELAAKYIGEHL